VLFLFAKSLGWMEEFISSASRTLAEVAHLNLQHAEDLAFHYVSRLTSFEEEMRPHEGEISSLAQAPMPPSQDVPVFSRLNTFSRRNELVQDRDAGDMWYTFLPPRERPCQY
ncbi:MAG TPA: hypothetical protein VNF99_01395, partial [Stellaceae bacterium]|nr:hypothetical protein [Stellaceae bacterium]